MSLLGEVESYALPLLRGIKPHVILTAPNGQELWIDVTPPQVAGQSDTAPSLWPNGFKTSLGTGEPPALPNVTTSAPQYFAQQAPTLLSAPGFLGVAWGVWLAVAVFFAVLPLVGIYLWKKG